LLTNTHLTKIMIRTSEEIRDAIRSTDIHARVSFGRHRLVLQEIERATIDIGVGLLFHQGAGDPDQMPLGGYLDNPVVRHLSELKTLREIIEQSPQFAEATKRLVPLHAELAEAEAREAEAATAAQNAENAVEAAEEAARVKLLAKVDADPGVQKARANLAGIKRLGQPLDPEPEDIARELAADLH
jgi:hypothetical protein